MIKKIQIEFSLFIFLLISILFSNGFDIWILKFFSQFNYGLGSNYLKYFFVEITDLGDSLWYFVFFIILFFISYLMKISHIIGDEKYFYIKKFSIFGVLFSLLINKSFT